MTVFVLLLYTMIGCVICLGIEFIPATNISGSLGYGGLTDRQKEAILDIHNNIRKNVIPMASDMIKMNWDPILEAISSHYIEKCEFTHNVNRHLEYVQASELIGVTLSPNSTWVGENIAWGVGNCGKDNEYIDCGDIFEGINRWFKESENYDILRNRCTGQCSLYTQMVWANSSNIGCSSKICSGNKTILVCNYYPGGNHINKLPYTVGKSCSACQKSYPVCLNSLCMAKLPVDKKFVTSEVEDIMSIETFPNKTSLLTHTSHKSYDLQDDNILPIPIGWHSLHLQASCIDIDFNNRIWAVLLNGSIASVSLEKNVDPTIYQYPDMFLMFKTVSVYKYNIWALLDDKNTVVYLSLANNNKKWYKVDTADMEIRQIETGSKGVVWLLTEDRKLYYRSEITIENPTGLSWTYITTDWKSTIKAISCGEFACWINCEDDAVYVRGGIEGGIPQGTHWINSNITMNLIYSGNNGYTIGRMNPSLLNVSESSNDEYFWRVGVTRSNVVGSDWARIKLPPAYHVAIGSENIVVIQTNNNIIINDSLPVDNIIKKQESNPLINTENTTDQKSNNDINDSELILKNSPEKSLRINKDEMSNSIAKILTEIKTYKTPMYISPKHDENLVTPSVTPLFETTKEMINTVSNKRFRKKKIKENNSENNHDHKYSNDVLMEKTTNDYNRLTQTTISPDYSTVEPIKEIQEYDTLEDSEKILHQKKKESKTHKQKISHNRFVSKISRDDELEATVSTDKEIDEYEHRQFPADNQKYNREENQNIDKNLFDQYEINCCNIPDSLCPNLNSDCNSYIECDGNKPLIKYCDQNQIFDPYTRVCTDIAKSFYICDHKNVQDPKDMHFQKDEFYFPALTTKYPSLSSNEAPKNLNYDLNYTRQHYIPRMNNNHTDHYRGVLRETWFNLPNTDLTIKSLFDDKRFPDFPDEYLVLDRFESPVNSGDFYGQRLSSYYLAPETGYYVFYLSCDDECELWVGTNQTQISLEKVAALTSNHSTSFREWNKFPEEQATIFIKMTKNQFYMIQAFMRETMLEDHISVGVLVPNGKLDLPITQNLFLIPLNTIDMNTAEEFG